MLPPPRTHHTHTYIHYTPTHAYLYTGVYQALLDEGRVLNSEEALQVDEQESGSGGSSSGGSTDEEDFDDDDDFRDGGIVDPASDPLLAYQRTRSGMSLERDSDSVLSNKTGLQATFMYTLSSANGIKAATSIALRALQSTWLFECGEDSQRSLLGHPLVDWKRIDRIFVSSMSPEAVLGLPGMLCTISASRERGHEAADIPVHVYGPPGLVSWVVSMLAVSKTYVEMPVILHEFTPRAVAPEQITDPQVVLKRARLYAVPVPPDQLNPEGYYDGQLSTMLSRHTRKKQGSGIDARSGTLPQELPPPGDPRLEGKIPVSQMTWTVRLDNMYTAKAAPLRSKVPTLGYCISEADRSGKMYPRVAQQLGVNAQELLADLKAGMEVVLDDGATVVRPEQCVGPARPGRRLAIVPPCTDSLSFAAANGPADLVIHSMVPPEGMRVESLDKVAAMAGACGRAFQAKETVLWQPFTSFLDSAEAEDAEYPFRAIDVAREAFGDEHVTVGGSFRVHQWDRPQSDPYPPELDPSLRHLIT